MACQHGRAEENRGKGDDIEAGMGAASLALREMKGYVYKQFSERGMGSGGKWKGGRGRARARRTVTAL